METKPITFTDTIEFSRPLLLLVGNRSLFINESACLITRRVHQQSISDETGMVEHISDQPIRKHLRFIVDGQLLASTKISGDGLAGKLVRREDESIELHLVESRTRLNRRHAALSHS